MSLAQRVGLDRPELRAWAMYDWANSAFITVVVAAVFPIYFSKVVAAGWSEATATHRFAIVTAISLGLSAVLGPLLGALADVAPVKKRLLGGFMVLGAGGTAALFFVDRGDTGLALFLFALTNVAATSSFVFYDSLLPHLARPDEIDRVSTAGYALGYVGGGVLLALDLLLILEPGWFGLGSGTLATRLAFVSVAVWWFGFSLPLLFRVEEPRVVAAPRTGSLVGRSIRSLAGTFHELRRYRQALLFLCAFLVFNDGIGTIIRMATIYGTELHIGATPMIVALLITQFVGIPCSFGFGQLAGRLGSKRSILLGLAVFGVVSILGYFMTSAAHFYLLAGLVGTVQGGTQALSRSLFASMIPKDKSSEMFGLFGVFEKFAGIIGPAVFAAIQGATGSSRNAVLSVIGFFVVGAGLLLLVDVEAGRSAVTDRAA